MTEKKRVLSAIQPTGDLHFGNYFGAVQNWVKLQENYECFYGVVNYHAMTMPYKPAKLRQATWDMVINLLALGVDKDNLFIQSMVPEHTELTWIFNCFCSYGQLTRMTQFKDKSVQSEGTDGGFISAGVFDYPVLQAADVLIYRAQVVPVGKDQEQHLELTRQIARRFNAQVGKEYFEIPEVMYSEALKIASPADPTIKMSKSKGPKHYISVFEEEKALRKKIRSAVTGMDQGDMENMSPGIRNLLTLLKVAGRADLELAFIEDYKAEQLKFVELKDATADALVALTTQFRARREEFVANRREVKDAIKASSARIRAVAQETLKEVKELAGLMSI